MYLAAVLSLLVWLALWYGIFYLKFANRDVIVELRNSLKTMNKELSKLTLDSEEFKQQNVILRDKVTDLLNKNEDLIWVVSELSRYYYQIKVWASKVEELSKYLKLPDENIEKKVEQYSSMYDMKENHGDNKQHSDNPKSFF